MNAEATYLALPTPNRANHLWRYTPWHRIHPTGSHSDLPIEVSTPTLSLTLLDGSDVPDGVELLASEEQLEIAPHDEVAAAFLRAVTEGEGAVLRIADGVTLRQPLLLEVAAEGEVCSLNLAYDIGTNSQAEVVTMVSGSADWFGLLRQGKIAPAAIFNDVVVNRLGSGHFLRVDGLLVEQDAQVKAGTVGNGAKRTKADLRWQLSGRGASLEVNGSMAAMGEQHSDHHIEIMHQARDTYSRLNWHSACGGSSRTVGTGMLRVAHGAKGSDAAQLFHNLLLSHSAEADSIPELEVLENEVVGCGHGTANGPVDEEQVFYLQSRGFSEAGARALLIAAFLNATVSQMGSEVLHEWLAELLNVGLAN